MAILVTRPAPNGEELCQLLNQQGFATLYAPLFDIEKGRELNQLPTLLQNLQSGDYVFAVSKNAIVYADQVLKNIGLHWRSDLNYFAVGRRSAEYFSALTEHPVLYPYPNENSEGLLALPQMQQLEKKKSLFYAVTVDGNCFANKWKHWAPVWKWSNVISELPKNMIIFNKSVFGNALELTL